MRHASALVSETLEVDYLLLRGISCSVGKGLASLKIDRGRETERGAQLSQYAATSSATKGSSIIASKISSHANQEGRVGKLWGTGRKVPYLCVVR